MSEETKNNAAKLTDEAVEEATGGFDIELQITTFVTCQRCKERYSFDGDGSGKTPPCPKCGYRQRPKPFGRPGLL